MATLPDYAWRRTLEIGIQIESLNYIDLCSFSATSRHFDELSKEPALWASLLSLDFPSSLPFDQTPSKDLYRDELETENYECLVKWLDEVRLDDSSFYNWETGRPPQRSLDTDFNYTEFSVPPVDMNFVDSIISDEHLLSLLMTDDSSQVPPCAARPSAREMIQSSGFKENIWRRRDKALKLKVIPNSKSYVPLNRRTLRSFPRNI